MAAQGIPGATYRLQFGPRLGFREARRLVPYLARLGVTTLYASPLLQARTGSTHGYDVTDPTRLNPDLGMPRGFRALARGLRRHDMGLLLDIVPNHQATVPENPWWADLLENGGYSPYANYFDIDWAAGEGRIVLPLLGSPLETTLKNGNIRLGLGDDGYYLDCHGLRLPLDIRSYGELLARIVPDVQSNPVVTPVRLRCLQQLTAAARRLSPLPHEPSPNRDAAYRKRQALKRGFLNLIRADHIIKEWAERGLELINNAGTGRQLRKLLDRQAYRLASWKAGDLPPNYRRFFDINDLVGVRVERPAVFAATHDLVFRLIGEGSVTGLRVDHIDGLADPPQYLTRLARQLAALREASGCPSCYLIVEKILLGEERLPPGWPLDGTTGYDFLNQVNALLIDRRGAAPLSRIYTDFTSQVPPFPDLAVAKKRQVIQELFPGETTALAGELSGLFRSLGTEVEPEKAAELITGITANLSVYRTYLATSGAVPDDEGYLQTALNALRERNPALADSLPNGWDGIFSPGFVDSLAAEATAAWRHFIRRWQQFSAAVMAKGVEDTALYNYSRFISLNEVGSSPATEGLSVAGFHQGNIARREATPHTLNATATHDTKRGEDVRARLNVLSEIPDEWGARLESWHRWNRNKKRRVAGRAVPEPDMEMLLYQTLLGAWPLDVRELPAFRERLADYLVKAAREGKAVTSWRAPDPAYEAALVGFMKTILDDTGGNRFLADFRQLAGRGAFHGALNSLTQVLLKITSPGVPDFYQGTELWDLSLVDPDNRRPVDFTRRRCLLGSIMRQEARDQGVLIKKLLETWPDGRVKLYLTYKALQARQAYAAVFREGDYVPLDVTGPRQENVVAFARHRDEDWVLIVVPRLTAGLVSADEFPLGWEVWGDDRLPLPGNLPGSWYNWLTGQTIPPPSEGTRLRLSDILSTFPVALLTSPADRRS